MVFPEILLWWCSGLIASSVAVKIGVQNDHYKLCINANSNLICSTQSDASLPDIPNPSSYGLSFKGDNCGEYEDTCVQNIQLTAATPVVWYRKNGCFYEYKEDSDQKALMCTSLDKCAEKKKMKNPYFRFEDTQPGPYLSRMGSNVGPVCPHPDGSHWNSFQKNPKGQDPVSRWNEHGEIPTTEETSQNIQSVDVSSPGSIANANVETSSNNGEPITGDPDAESNAYTGTEQSGANVAMGGGQALSDEDLQQYMDVEKRSVKRAWKPFTA